MLKIDLVWLRNRIQHLKNREKMHKLTKLMRDLLHYKSSRQALKKIRLSNDEKGVSWKKQKMTVLVLFHAFIR